jgi:hypothetical protein
MKIKRRFGGTWGLHLQSQRISQSRNQPEISDSQLLSRWILAYIYLLKARSSGKNYSSIFPWYDTDLIEKDTSNNSSIVACVFVAAVMFLQSRCLATMWGYN